MDWKAAEMIELLKRQRHDFLNHLQVIDAYMQLNNNERALSYIRESLVKMGHIGRIMHLQPAELALISLLKIEMLLDKGITLELKIHTVIEKPLLGIEEIIPIWTVAWDAALALACTGNALHVSLAYKENYYCLHFAAKPAAQIPSEIKVLKKMTAHSKSIFNYEHQKGEMNLLFPGS